MIPENPNDKYLITGSGGQLGSELCRQLRDRCVGIDISDVDITDRLAVQAVLQRERPTHLVNTAAYTAVDRAEETPEICRSVNADAVQFLAEESAAIDCTLVQISTDYVFGGARGNEKPHLESDPTTAAGVYAATKRQGEIHAATNPKHFVVRSCGLYGDAGPTATGNFVTTMLRLGKDRPSLSVVNDQHCTPTWVRELASAIIFLSRTDNFGIFHIVNEGATTWFEMAKEIFKIANIDCEVNPITTEQYGALAPRPAYSVLNTDKYKKLGGPKMSMWNEALAQYVDHHLTVVRNG